MSNNNGNKLPEKYMDPIDIYFINSIEKLCPYLKQVGFTPNQLTTISFIFGIISCICYYYKKYIISGILFIISYYFDCIDGYYARKYNMGSVFGSYYDIISDHIILGNLSLLFIFNKKISIKPKIIIIIIILLLYFLTIIHVSCQEKYTKKHNNDNVSEGLKILDIIKCNNHDNMLYTRFFGVGTTALIFSIIIISHDLFINK